MEIRYSITLHPLVTIRDIPRLDTFWRQTMRDAIREKLRTSPEAYGKPLRYTLRGCRTLRIGDYRIVYRIESRTVRIIALIHRSEGYEGLEKRL